MIFIRQISPKLALNTGVDFPSSQEEWSLLMPHGLRLSIKRHSAEGKEVFVPLKRAKSDPTLVHYIPMSKVHA